jgi:hypothetical protein
MVLIFDSRGNGGGGVSPTITGDHQNRITDYTAIVVMKEIVLESNQNHAIAADTEVCPTLPASMGCGGGYVPMTVEGRMHTLPCDIKCYRESHYGDYYRTDVCNGVRASGASCGGGSEALIVQRTTDYTEMVVTSDEDEESV